MRIPSSESIFFMTIVVAFIGVLGALMALQLERTRELGTLRAAGMTLQQLWRLTLLESGLMGAAAGLLSIPTGLVLATVLIYVINLRSFGWTMRLEADPWYFAEAFVFAVAAAVLASVYPLIRLQRRSLAEAEPAARPCSLRTSDTLTPALSTAAWTLAGSSEVWSASRNRTSGL